jgi:opacity protein-like surface antigen
MNKINKQTSLVSRMTTAVASGSVAAALTIFAPQAMAADPTEMELKIKQMEESLRMMRQELDSVRQQNEAQRVDALEERVTMVELSDDYVKKGNSTIVFRGGFQHMTNGTRANESFSDFWAATAPDLLGLVPRPSNGGQRDGWYVGAAVEHTLSEDLFGMWDEADLLGEISFQWSRYNSENGLINEGEVGAVRAVPAAGVAIGLLANGNPLLVNGDAQSNLTGITISQFTLSASPKIKFLPDSAIRPWIIPVGLDIHVISPPSNAATVLMAGMQFGGGVEYTLWKNIVIGGDARYHWAQKIDGSDPRFWQAGGYLGFKF